MAYLSFSELGGVAMARARVPAAVATPAADPVPARTERLSALEWSVVAIARKDGRASLNRPGRMSVAMRVLFRQHNPRLADERLEALRRMAVLTWRDGYTVASREVRAFLDAGFTTGQYELMVDSIQAAKATPRRLAA
jgi:hypothetical protein